VVHWLYAATSPQLKDGWGVRLADMLDSLFNMTRHRTAIRLASRA
jgi:hypothetical protein